MALTKVNSGGIEDGSIVNADIKADAAITVSKISGAMPLAGGIFTGDVKFLNQSNSGKDLNWDESDDSLEFSDGVKVSLGSDADAYLRHDGTNCSLRNTTGDLYIEDSGGNIYIQAKAGEKSIDCFGDGAVHLYHDNVEKIKTTATGVNVTGDVKGTYGLGRRNHLINGSMRIAQRGTTNSTINTYGPCDRWRSYGGALDLTVSQQTSAIAYDSGYCLRVQRNNGTSQVNPTGVCQGLESKDSYIFAGKKVTLSFKAECGANYSNASSVMTSSIRTGEGTDQNPVGMTNSETNSQSNTLTTSVQTFTHTHTIPDDKTQMTVSFQFTPVGTAGANDWFSIGDVQLEIGEATPFELRPIATELAECQRYYENSYPPGYYPGHNFNEVYSFGTSKPCAQNFIASDDTVTAISYPLMVTKRGNPTVTVYNANTGATGTAHTYKGTGGTSVAVTLTVVQAGPNMALLGMTLGAANQANESYFHYQAEAEL